MRTLPSGGRRRHLLGVPVHAATCADRRHRQFLDSLKHPYFTLPDPMGGTFSLQPDFGINVFDCDRSTTAVGVSGSMLARVGARSFVIPSAD